MQSSQVITVVRSVLLVGLFAFFLVSYVLGLVHAQVAQGLPRVAGEDPGIRVLLMNRERQPPSYVSNRIEVGVLQAALLVSPDMPDRSLALKTGDRIVIQPDAGDGLMVSTQGHNDRWPVSSLRIIPRVPSRLPSADAPVRSPALLDPTRFEAAGDGAVFAIGKRRYRGSLEIYWKSATQVCGVNALPLESYIEGVIAVEMKSSFPLEALKAQAIASRSYAYATELRSRTAKRGYDLTDTTDDQEYRGTGNGSDLVDTAVRETRGLILYTRNATPFVPLFCASSGGFTESVDEVMDHATDVYGHEPLSQYMPRQPDPYCKPAAEALGYVSTHWLSTAVIGPKEIRQRVAEYLQRAGDGRTIGYVINLEAGRRDPVSGRVETVLIHHTLGKPIELSCSLFRLLMGPQVLRSTLWTADSPSKVDSPDHKVKDYQIRCYGFGHGVGMSQISAWYLADKEGWSGSQILQFFYPGAVLQPW